jgi:hypothetical protein
MELIIIRGTQNSGKSTTAACVHNEIIARGAQPKMTHIYADVIPIMELRDFESVLDYDRVRVAIISQGDDADKLHERIERLCWEWRPNALVVCCRSMNKTGSSYEMLQKKYPTWINTAIEYWPNVVATNNWQTILAAKQQTANQIANQIRNIVVTL